MTDEPIHVWRRLIALLIDYSLIYIMVPVAIALIQPNIETKIQVPSLINTQACELASELGIYEGTTEQMKHEKYQSQPAAKCRFSSNGFLEKNYLILRVGYVEGNGTYTKSISILVNSNLEAIPLFDLSPFLYTLVPLVFAVILFIFGNTPGKKILSLYLENQTKEKRTLVRYIKREYLRNFPIVGIGIYQILFGIIYHPPVDIETEIANIKSIILENSGAFTSLLVTISLVIIVILPYPLSLRRWNGIFFYDKATGFDVHKLSSLEENVS